jgi:FkbM family methyltransferase
MSLRSSAIAGARSLLRRFDIRLVRDRAMRDPVRLLLLKAREMGVGTILDVGANTGQFAQEVFGAGWDGTIVSFEPIGEPHARLAENARSRPAWIVPPPVAIGASEAVTQINVSENIVSSSLLPVGAASTEVLGETQYVRTETIRVRRLDDAADPAWPSPYAIKADTQGFELEVMKGAPETLRRTRVLMLEMSLARLYEGGARLGELYGFVEDAGFRCIALTEGFADYDRNEVLQVDGIFVRDGA